MRDFGGLFTMGTLFAYLSATLGVHEEPLRIQPDAPLQLRYAVAVWDMPVNSDGVEKTYQAWLAKEQSR